MAIQDITFLSATELGSAIKAKQVSPVEVVEAYLDRIERIDPLINSYICLLYTSPSPRDRTRSRMPSSA